MKSLSTRVCGMEEGFGFQGPGRGVPGKKENTSVHRRAPRDRLYQPEQTGEGRKELRRASRKGGGERGVGDKKP